MPYAAKNPRAWQGIFREIDCHGQPVEVLTIADLHLGDPGSSRDLAQSLINSVKDNENRYCILGGDLMNTAITGSKSDSYAETMTPMEELEACAGMLEPIRDKILCIIPGNHEERITRQVGTDMTRMLAMKLDILDRFSAEAALLLLRFGHLKGARPGAPVNYAIYVNHGHGGGRRPGGKINALADFASIVDADVYIVGHTHMPATFKQQTYRVNFTTHSAQLYEQLFVNTASALDYGGYGKRNGYQPASNSYPVITLACDRKYATVTL